LFLDTQNYPNWFLVLSYCMAGPPSPEGKKTPGGVFVGGFFALTKRGLEASGVRKGEWCQLLGLVEGVWGCCGWVRLGGIMTAGMGVGERWEKCFKGGCS